MKVISKRTGEVSFADNLPSNLKNYIIPDATLQYAGGAMGKYIWQEIRFPDSSVNYFDLLPEGEDRLIFIGQEAALVFQLQLRNSLFSTMEGLGDVNLHEYGFNIFYVPHMYREMNLVKKKYSGLQINLTPELLLRFGSRYPQVEDFSRKIALRLPARLSHVNQVANTAMMEMIDDLRLNPLLFDTEDLLEHAFTRMQESPVKRTYRIAQSQVEKIYAAKELLFSSLQENYTLHELSDLMNISVYHLKMGFPAIYGVSAANMIFLERMKVARGLVINSDKKMSEIARLLGYGESSFARAFKTHHGVYPSESRLKR
jgi:AraC-like DNA-binding protein